MKKNQVDKSASFEERRSHLSLGKKALLAKRLREIAGGTSEKHVIHRYFRQENNTPLSYAQQQLWILMQLDPDSPTYNIPIGLHLRGQLDIHALEMSIHEIVQRHEVLRTTFVASEGQPQQIVHTEVLTPLQVVDLRTYPAEDREIEAQRLVLKEARTPFDLVHGPLFRTTLLQLGEEEYILFLNVHHIVFDGWSEDVVFKELSEFYVAHLSGKPCFLPELPIQYADYSIWQREWLQGKILDEQVAYWEEQLSGAPPLLELPIDRPRPLEQSPEGAVSWFELPEGILKGLKRISRLEGATLFMILLAAFQVLLYRYSGQRDIVVGTPIANRMRKETERLIGFFVNTLVLRTQLGDNLGFRELLRRVRGTALEAYAHQDLPFERLVEYLRPARSLSYNPIFNVMFTFQNASADEPGLAGLETNRLNLHTATTKFDLNVLVRESQKGLVGGIEYSTALFDRSTIERMIGCYQTLLESIIANPEQRISDLPILTEAARRQILVEWNNTKVTSPNDKCVHQLFEEQVERAPDAVAVVFEDQHLTYTELNARANQLAHYLHSQGVGPDVLVGICVERSLELIVGLLGILKAGGAYVPLDPTYPKKRLAHMLVDSSISVLITQERLLDSLPKHSAKVICLDKDWQALMADYGITNPISSHQPENLAYVIYTSGSTGKPKGAGITHANVTRLFKATQDWYHFAPEDTWSLFHSFSFDFSVWEIWGALVYGGRLVIISYLMSRSPQEFYKLLVQEHITILNQTPSAFRQLIAAEQETGLDSNLSLRLVIFGGEALEIQSLGPWFELHGDQRPELVNMYGITETTVHVTYHPIRHSDLEATTGSMIGQPIPDLAIYLLDRQQNLVPIGVPGEVCVGGAGLARGYLNRPDLTAEKFIPNSFSGAPGARMYKTGDLARYLLDGSIEYLGRIDNQVKIRGFRIELGEIEAVLAALPEVSEVVILAREDTPGDKRLVAYLVMQAEHVMPGAAELKSKLSQFLPEYMLPAHFMQLEQLPLTLNGKIDRKALPAPDMLRNEIDYVAPHSDLEKIISQVWMEVLHIEKVGIHDNFFDLGGHSLLATQVHALLRKQLHNDLKLVDLFQYPTISTLTSYLSTTKAPVNSPNSLRAQLRRDLIKQPEEGIAVVGMAGRFAAARDTDTFWKNLCAGKEAITFFSEEELRAAGVADELLGNPRYVKAGSVLENIEGFDAFFFGYNPHEATLMDPQQRVFLESAWEALERAGYDSEQYAGRIGVYASISTNKYLLYNLLSNPGLMHSMGGLQTMLGNDKDFLTTRVSYKLNLKGPSVNVQTACSSSLVAVHLACQSLLRGESDMALAGGVAISLPQQSGYLYEEGGIASPDGHCRAFDAQAKGTIGGNGVGVVVLKRLSEALKDGDAVCAVIKGTAINNDGSLKVGYTAPSVGGQADVIAEAQSLAGVKPETITYVEAHGTGTSLGDPIEIAALTQAFARSGRHQKKGVCAIGAVKTNIGHLDVASGVAGLIKTILALQNRAIPPTLHFKSPNPGIDFEHSPFYINTALTAWPVGSTPRRAGVSSFGIGGTNAHVVLEEAPWVDSSSPSRPWQLLLLSAKTNTALEKATSNLVEHLRTHPEQKLADVAYTLQVGRHIFNQRRAIVCHGVNDAITALETIDSKRVFTDTQEEKEPAVAFMFTGQGAQYVSMGRELYTQEPVFHKEVDQCSELLQPYLGLDLRAVLYPDPAHEKEAAEQLNQTWLTQPALFVIEYALAQLWMSWGIRPQAMIGHSIGEYVAACLAGVFKLEDALALVATRGRLMQSLPSGAMLAVPLAESEAQTLLGNALSLAAVNSPTMCVVSGPIVHIVALEQQLNEKNVECRRLQTSHAFHSVMMDPILELFVAEVNRVKLHPPQIPFISNLTGEWITAAQATNPTYWARHLRNTVRFGDGLGQLLKESTTVLMEIGPGQTLTTLALNHPSRTTGHIALSCLHHAKDSRSDQAFLLTTLGKLWLTGISVDWSAFYQAERRYRVPLPTYPFERQRCWVEPSKERGQAQSDRICKKKNISDWLYIPSWTPKPLRSQTPMWIPENCLVFVDESGLGLVLAERLKEKGVMVITARAGVGWQQIDDGQYMLDPHCPDHYEQLFSELVKNEKTPDIIVHLWSLTQTEEQASGPEYFARIQPLGFNSLVYLTQALNEHSILKPIHIEVLSNGIYPLEGAIQPEKATILGPCRVIPQELPSITCRYVDIIAPCKGTQQETKLVNQLITQILDKPSNGTFAWRDEQRWEQDFKLLELQKEVDNIGILRENGVYVITGGLGYVGLELAEYLANRAKVRLALIGHSVFPPREEWKWRLATQGEQDDLNRKIRRIQAMEELGAEVILLNADVSDQEAIQAAISQIDRRWGNIHGVFHLAGLVNNMNFIQELTTYQYEAHFHPKVYGLFNLERALHGRELDFCMLFSSLASILGGLGFGAYSAANNFMDASARKHNQQSSVRWISVNWDGWQTDETQSDKKTIGTILNELTIAPAEGMRALQSILSDKQVSSQIVVSTGDLQARTNQWVKLESLKDQERGKQSDPVVLQARPALHSNYLAPRNQIEETLAAIWQELLGIDQIGVHDNYFELGGDSLNALRVILKANQLEIRLNFHQMQKYQTIAQIAEHLSYEDLSSNLTELPPLERIPLTPSQKRVLSYADQAGITLNGWTVPVLLEIPAYSDSTVVQLALKAVYSHHESLQLSFQYENNSWVIFRHAPDAYLPLRYVDMSGLHPNERVSMMDKEIVELQEQFNIGKGVFQSIYFYSNEQSHLFFLVSHLVFDDVSWWIFLRDLETVYLGYKNGDVIGLPPTTPFSRWSQQLVDYAQSSEALRDAGYWLSKQSFFSFDAIIPIDDTQGDNSWLSEEILSSLLSSEETQLLIAGISKRYKTSINDILLMALAHALHMWANSPIVTVDVTLQARVEVFDELDMVNTIGWLTSKFPLALNVDSENTVFEKLKLVNEQTKLLVRKGVSYDALRYYGPNAEVRQKLNAIRKPNVNFMYRGKLDTTKRYSSLFKTDARHFKFQPPSGQREYILEVFSQITDGQLTTEWHYNKNIHKRETIEKLAEWFNEILRELLSYHNTSQK